MDSTGVVTGLNGLDFVGVLVVDDILIVDG